MNSFKVERTQDKTHNMQKYSEIQTMSLSSRYMNNLYFYAISDDTETRPHSFLSFLATPRAYLSSGARD